MARLKVFSTGICPICEKTKHLLQKWGIEYEEVRNDSDADGRKEFNIKTKSASTQFIHSITPAIPSVRRHVAR